MQTTTSQTIRIECSERDEGAVRVEDAFPNNKPRVRWFAPLRGYTTYGAGNGCGTLHPTSADALAATDAARPHVVGVTEGGLVVDVGLSPGLTTLRPVAADAYGVHPGLSYIASPGGSRGVRLK